MSSERVQELQLLSDGVAKYLNAHYSSEQRAQIVKSPEGWGREHWRGFAELGLIGAAFHEAQGGFGGEGGDIAAVMRALGSGLVAEPFVDACVVAAVLLRHGEATRALALCDEIIAADRIITTGLYEFSSRYDPYAFSTTATAEGDDYILNGAKTGVLGAPYADGVVLSAMTDDGRPGLFLVQPDDDGVHVKPYATIGGIRAGDISMANVRLSADRMIVGPDNAKVAIEAAIAMGVVAIAAEGAAVCERMCALTQEYCRGREQFGQPIASFQVLQHKMADMFVSAQELSAVAETLAEKVDGDDPAIQQAVSAAKVQLSKSCKFVGETAIQLHGAMGMTDEMEIGHFFKRGLMLAQMFGDHDYHVRRYQALDALSNATSKANVA